MSWKRIVLEKVSGHEGGFTSLNLNRDNAGLSVGIIQWAQAPGQLGVLLNAQYRAAPELFIQHFGGPVTARELWGWATVRSFTVLYDCAVQQGAGFVKNHAKKVHEQLSPDATPNQVLQRFATTAYAHFRRSSTPDGAAKADGSYPRSSRTVWKLPDCPTPHPAARFATAAYFRLRLRSGTPFRWSS
jgi:hypothetical protein